MNARTQMIASGRRVIQGGGNQGGALVVSRRLIPMLLSGKPTGNAGWVQAGGWGGGGCTKTGIPR